MTTLRGSSCRLRHSDVSMLQCRGARVDSGRCCHQSEASLTVPMWAFDFQRAALHACRNCRPARARTHTHAHVRSRTPPHTWDAQIAHHPLFRCTSTFHRQSTHFILSMPTPGPTTQHWHRHPLTLSLICTHMHDRQQMHAHILHSCVTGSRPCGRSLDCHLNLGKTLRRVKCICEVRPTHVSCRTTSRSLEARP